MIMSMFQRVVRTALLFFGMLVFCGEALAVPYADFRADIAYRQEGKSSRHCGSAMSSGRYARMDLDLGSAGAFALIVDTQEHLLRVLSYRLQAYVEIPVSGDPRNWRHLVQSAAAAVMPQSMGMISLQEKEYTPLGKDNWEGYPVHKSRVVFEAGFMGSVNRFTLEVWENEVFSPFPMRAFSEETRTTHAASAALVNIAAELSSLSMFQIPQGFTRYTSIMDLVLYALTAF